MGERQRSALMLMAGWVPLGRILGTWDLGPAAWVCWYVAGVAVSQTKPG